MTTLPGLSFCDPSRPRNSTSSVVRRHNTSATSQCAASATTLLPFHRFTKHRDRFCARLNESGTPWRNAEPATPVLSLAGHAERWSGCGRVVVVGGMPVERGVGVC
jgi:hypothetical protein